MDCPNFYGDSAIHAAAQLGHIESLTILRDAGAVTDRRNRHGLTPLCLAASKGHSQAVVIIAHNLSKKAINAYCGGYTALHWCCVTGIDAACGFLAKKGADASLRAEPDGETCLYKAATYCHSPCVDILLDAGCDANATNSDGATALLACAASGDYASLDLLIARGGDVHKADLAGRTPLGVAAQKGNLSCVSRLAAAGALCHHRRRPPATRSSTASSTSYRAFPSRRRRVRRRTWRRGAGGDWCACVLVLTVSSRFRLRRGRSAFAGAIAARASSRARSAASASPIPVVSGCAPPSTRRAIRAVSSSVVTASRRSSSVAAGSL